MKTVKPDVKFASWGEWIKYIVETNEQIRNRNECSGFCKIFSKGKRNEVTGSSEEVR